MAKRMLSLVGVAAGIAPIVVAVLPAATAGAHGYISSPLSRQAQCAQGLVSCGDIKYEPQSVEGPKGLMNCSGDKYTELDDDSKGWQVQDVGTTVDFTWTNTAQHRTANWEYYIDNTLIEEVDGNNEMPGDTVTHTIDLGQYSGYQKLIAIWNIGDTANAFYSCVDLNVDGSGSDTTDTDTTDTDTTDSNTTDTSTGSATDSQSESQDQQRPDRRRPNGPGHQQGRHLRGAH
ncbi:lytic polysaccharide monooxygenase auxiliary activity family 9 protein [Nocardia sp. 004]|uniref:lytic polysaccharide monooxygenase auxiliary activity family 9 protein n=1 Tax=Nocardia sp. 004 TaxID=3385978 RepID=UPI0039A2BA61